MCHRGMLRTKFDDGDAAAIVAMQIEDGPLTVNGRSPPRGRTVRVDPHR